MPPKENTSPSFILFADIAGYTALMQKDESSAAQLLQKFRTSLQELVPLHQGKVINFYGDGALCIFDNPIKMTKAAMQLQERYQNEPVVPVRIGLHNGAVFFEDNNAYGNAINLASRIESIGIKGSITLSKNIYQHLQYHETIEAVSLGSFAFKNVKDKMEIFAISNKGFVVPKKSEIKGKLQEKKTNPIPIVLITIALMGLLFFGYNQFLVPQKGLDWEQSLAVIPLENLDKDPTQEYFSDGISQDILTNLSGIKELQVISFNSSKKYRDTEKSVQEIGKELGVKHLLLGSVHQVGEKLRVRAMLVNAETDQQLWAERYDREIEDVFDIQSEVAKNIADVLKTQFSPDIAKRINQKPTNNFEAYQYYSQGRYQWELRSQKSLQKALELFQKAIELDDKFALAYAGLAQTYVTIGSNQYDLPSVAFPKAKEYAEKTLEINPDLADAYTTLGAYYYDFDFQFDKCLSYFQRAIELKPNDATSHQWLAEAYYAKGDPINARNELEIAKQLNPQSMILQLVDASFKLGENKADESVEMKEALVKKYPDVYAMKTSLLFTYWEKGEVDKAWAYLRELDPNQQIKPYWIEMYAKTGQFDKLREIRATIKDEPSDYMRKYYYELIDFKLLLEKGDIVGYIEKIDSLIFIDKNRNLFTQQNFHPPDSVCQHPRYQQMMEERGYRLILRDF